MNKIQTIYEIEYNRKIKYVQALELREHGEFYVPDDGYYLTLGVSAFLTYSDAVNYLKSEINKEMDTLQEILDNLG